MAGHPGNPDAPPEASDDLGHAVPSTGPARRVVSLVPSLTEAIASVDADALVGVTDWCTHPVDLSATRIRGTKNPDIQRIIEMFPDVVIANKEENRELDVRRLRDAGVPVWVTDIETLDQAFSSLERLFDEALGWDRPAWLGEAREVWSAPPSQPTMSVVVPIWRDPWMVVGPATFTADLLGRQGCELTSVAQGVAHGRYPTVDLPELDSAGADVVILPDEPYAFTDADGPECFSTPTVLASGRMLTWYGPSLVPARAYLEDLLAPWRSPSP